MKMKITFLFGTAFLSISALADDASGYKNFPGSYRLYGGDLGDTAEPTARSKNIAVGLDTKISKDLFESIGPDVKSEQVCVNHPKDRYRKRGTVQCIHSHDGGYSCTFGFDLIKGKSIIGSIC